MILTVGSVCFGLFVGYITYRTLARTADKTSISDLTAVIGAVGGGAVTTIVRPQTDNFGWYAIGLLAGFIGYAALYAIINGKTEFAKVMSLPRPAGELNAPVRGDSAPTEND